MNEHIRYANCKGGKVDERQDGLTDEWSQRTKTVVAAYRWTLQMDVTDGRYRWTSRYKHQRLNTRMTATNEQRQPRYGQKRDTLERNEYDVRNVNDLIQYAVSASSSTNGSTLFFFSLRFFFLMMAMYMRQQPATMARMPSPLPAPMATGTQIDVALSGRSVPTTNNNCHSCNCSLILNTQGSDCMHLLNVD